MTKKNNFLLEQNWYYFVRPIEIEIGSSDKSNRVAQYKNGKFFFCGLQDGIEAEFFRITGYAELSND